MARAVVDRAVYDEHRAIVARRVARGAELLIGGGVEDGVGERVRLAGAELELVSLPPALEGLVEAVGDRLCGFVADAARRARREAPSRMICESWSIE